jgi:sugar phosphate isomerase/epimerase
MTRPLVLHQITAMDVAPPDFARMTAEVGCDRISVFTNCPDMILPGQSAPLAFPTIGPEMKREMLAALSDSGVGVDGVEYFPIVEGLDVARYAAGLALGAELGGTRAVTHIHDIDGARAVETLGRLCELAAAQGLSLGVEFTPLTRGCLSLERAVWLVDQVGRADFGIGIDCLHLIRSGGTAADVAALDPRTIANGQICDGHGRHASDAYISEVHSRELPGRGDLPLHDILGALPASMPIEVEVPAEQYRSAGVSALDHLRAAVAASRLIVDALTPTR